MANDLVRRTWPWMTLAVITVAAFMYWLHLETSQLPDGLAAAGVTDEAGVTTVPDSVFAQAPERFRDRILLRSVVVNEVLGRASFSLDLPDREGYPAVLERRLVEEDTRVVSGDQVHLAGEVYALNDSIIGVWSQRGIFNNENRGKLAGSTTFLLVDSLDYAFPDEAEEEPAGEEASEEASEAAEG